MNERDYAAELYDKMKAEQDEYRDWLLTQEPSEILNHTYEYTMREDIVMAMEEMELTPNRAKALLRSTSPLADVYKEFERRCYAVYCTGGGNRSKTNGSSYLPSNQRTEPTREGQPQHLLHKGA